MAYPYDFRLSTLSQRAGYYGGVPNASVQNNGGFYSNAPIDWPSFQAVDSMPTNSQNNAGESVEHKLAPLDNNLRRQIVERVISTTTNPRIKAVLENFMGKETFPTRKSRLLSTIKKRFPEINDHELIESTWQALKTEEKRMPVNNLNLVPHNLKPLSKNPRKKVARKGKKLAPSNSNFRRQIVINVISASTDQQINRVLTKFNLNGGFPSCKSRFLSAASAYFRKIDDQELIESVWQALEVEEKRMIDSNLVPLPPKKKEKEKKMQRKRLRRLILKDPSVRLMLFRAAVNKLEEGRTKEVVQQMFQMEDVPQKKSVLKRLVKDGLGGNTELNTKIVNQIWGLMCEVKRDYENTNQPVASIQALTNLNHDLLELTSIKQEPVNLSLITQEPSELLSKEPVELHPSSKKRLAKSFKQEPMNLQSIKQEPAESRWHEPVESHPPNKKRAKSFKQEPLDFPATQIKAEPVDD